MENSLESRSLIIDPVLLRFLSDKLAKLEDMIQTVEHVQITDALLGEIYKELHTFQEQQQSSLQSIYQTLFTGYKTEYYAQLNSFIRSDGVKLLGLSLLHNKQTSKAIVDQKYTVAIDGAYWDEIQSNLLSTNLFAGILEKISKRYYQQLDQRIAEELKKVTFTLDKSIEVEYRQMYYQQPLPFEEFLVKISDRSPSSTNSSTNASSVNKVREDYERELEKKKVQELKTNQEKTFDHYESYFKMDEREIARIKRQAKDDHRPVKKITRREKFEGGSDKK